MIDQEQVKAEFRNNLREKIRLDLANSGNFFKDIGYEDIENWTPVLNEFRAAGYRVKIEEFIHRRLRSESEGGYRIVVRFGESQQEGTSCED